MDLSSEWIPELRHSLNTAIVWEHEVDAATSALRDAGAVQLALVHQEFEPRGMAMIAACKRLGIATVGVQHGTFYPLHTTYTPPPAQLAGAPVPDYFAVYGDYSKEVVSAYGSFPAQRVLVCAASRFDKLASNPPSREECRQRLELPPDRFVILVTTQTYAWFPRAAEAILLTAPANALVCIKTFAGELDTYRTLVEKSGRDAILFTDRFDDLLGACDVLVSASSTTILEATLLGKPTVCLNFSADPYYYPYVEEGVSEGARTPAEVAAIMNRLEGFRPSPEWNERRLRFLRRHLGPAAEGKAAEAFGASIQTLLATQQDSTTRSE